MQFRRPMYWRIEKDDAATYELRSFRCSIINPLLSYAIPSDTLIHKNNIERLMGILPDNSVLVESSVIYLIPPNPPDEPAETFFVPAASASNGTVLLGPYLERVGAFLECLRYVSKSSQLVSLNDFFSFFPKEVQLPPLRFPQVETESSAHIRAFIVDSAVQWKHLEMADELLAGEGVPIYGTLLLDAISAYRDKDYRRAILYSAMAVETMAGTRLSEVYSHHLAIRDADEKFRFISLPSHTGTIVKDPIYEYLESKTEFRLLIHEQALYVLGRSLLIENEPLYQAAMKLYKTRNKITHQGVPPTENTNDYFAINEQDTLACVNCAIEAFKWFGIPGGYVLPTTGFVRVKIPKWELPEESAG